MFGRRIPNTDSIITFVEQGVSFLGTYPIIAKAGSSCRSKGKSIRKFVLNRAVMVTVRDER